MVYCAPEMSPWRASLRAVTIVASLAGGCDDVYPGSTPIPRVDGSAAATPGPDLPSDAGTDAPGDAAQTTDANLMACEGCICSADTNFCFGGARGRDPKTPPQCDVGDGSTPKAGCNRIPPACAAKPTCACIINDLQPGYGCYLVCRDTAAGFLVYCPTP